MKENIFAYLKPQDLLECAGVCRKWNKIAEDKSLWVRFLGRFTRPFLHHPKVVYLDLSMFDITK